MAPWGAVALVLAAGAAWAWAGAGLLQRLPLEPDDHALALRCKAWVEGTLVGVLVVWLLRAYRMGPKPRTLVREVDQVLRHAPAGMARLGMDGRLLWANERLRDWLGLCPDEPLPETSFRALVCPADGAWVETQLERLRAGEIDHYQGERQCHNLRDGTSQPVLCTVSHVAAAHGEPEHLVCVLQSMRELQAARAAQALSEQRLRLAATVVDNTIEGVVVTDAESRILSVNASFTRLLGYTEDELLGRTPGVFKSGRHDKSFYEAMWDSMRRTGHWQGEIWNRRKNGEIFPERMSLSAVRGEGGQVTHYVCMFTDISEDKAQRERLEFLAHRDPLTGIANRAHFGELLADAVRDAGARGERMALLQLNLDRFKDVNGSYGHVVGDDVLKHIARQLQAALRPGDLLGRMAGDELAVLARNLRRPEDAIAVARELIAAVARPWRSPDGLAVVASASAGICLYPDHAGDAQLLQQGAHAAVYGAKAQGRGAWCFFHEGMTQSARERLAMEARLRQALRDPGQLQVHYQPQVDIASGRIVGAEALVRWFAPDTGRPVSPAQFIPVAEATGLIGPLGEWVLAEVCRQGQEWLAQGLQPLTLSINISPHQFHLTDLSGSVAAALQVSGYPPQALELEITESALAAHPEEARQMLERLRAQGLRVAVDDFGTGYSSLAHLKRFPIDVLKIDQGFIRDIPRNADDMAISAAIIAMGHSLGLSVLAEGVETPEQLAFLRERGCDTFQGYLCSRPVPPAEFAQLLEAQPVV